MNSLRKRGYRSSVAEIIVLMIFSLLLISGCGILGTQQDEEASNGHGLKYNVTEEDRTPSADEQKIIDNLYISNLQSDGLEYGNQIYSTLTITGQAMPEESIYSLKDLEELVRISFVNKKMNKHKLFAEIDGCYGLDFFKFMELSGIDDSNELTVLCEDSQGTQKTISYKKLAQNDKVILAIGDDEGPLGKDNDTNDFVKLMAEKSGGVEEEIEISRLTIGKGSTPKDPHYGHHDRKNYKDSLSATFTIEVYDNDREESKLVKTVEITTEELERMMSESPEKAVSNYYGTIGNQTSFQYAGVGGWMDHFQGIDFLWLLKEKAGIVSMEGSAELIGRDGEVYNTIDDIKYFDHEGKSDEYYVMTSDGVKVSGCIPMIGCVKNGYPILKEHEHESEAYVAYNHLNKTLENNGVTTEVGVVKNHNGPFTACFGNLDGYYGGEQMETAGDCTLIKIYME